MKSYLKWKTIHECWRFSYGESILDIIRVESNQSLNYFLKIDGERKFIDNWNFVLTVTKCWSSYEKALIIALEFNPSVS